MGDDETADHGEAERAAGIGAGAPAEGDGQGAGEGGDGGHHDGTEAHDTGLEDGFLGSLVAVAFRVEGEVDHHNRVLLHDADEHDQADVAVDVQLLLEKDERQQGAKRRGGQAGENRERVEEIFVENPENQIND